MLKHLSVQWVFLIGMLVTFFLDGSLSYGMLMFSYRLDSIIPCLSLLWLVFTLFFVGSDLHLIIWAAIVGTLFDWYYTGFFGVYLFIFPLIMYISKLLCQFLSDDFWNGLFVYFIDMLILLGLGTATSYFIDNMVDVVNKSKIEWLLFSSFLTLLLNLIIFSILYSPVRSLYNYCRKK